MKTNDLTYFQLKELEKGKQSQSEFSGNYMQQKTMKIQTSKTKRTSLKRAGPTEEGQELPGHQARGSGQLAEPRHQKADATSRTT